MLVESADITTPPLGADPAGLIGHYWMAARCASARPELDVPPGRSSWDRLLALIHLREEDERRNGAGQGMPDLGLVLTLSRLRVSDSVRSEMHYRRSVRQMVSGMMPADWDGDASKCNCLAGLGGWQSLLSVPILGVGRAAAQCHETDGRISGECCSRTVVGLRLSVSTHDTHIDSAVIAIHARVPISPRQARLCNKK